jgi:hypothetical protein
MNSLPKDVGAAGGGGYDPNDPNIKRVRQLLYLPLGFPSLCWNARVADFASLTLDQRHDGVVFRQDHDVGSNGFRYGWSVWNVHGFCKSSLPLMSRATTTFALLPGPAPKLAPMSKLE